LEHLPTTYYGRNGPVGDVFAVAAARSDSQVGIVGLGAGTLAAYDVPGMAITYYEIDPVVVRVASDPTLFTYLADAPTKPAIVLGDARLSLRDTPDAIYDLLVLDAFSSDAVPVHLLTVEALTDALRTVRPDGVIAIHISNRYYDLSPAVSAARDRLGLVTLHRESHVGNNPQDPTELGARWLSATRDPAVAATLQTDGWTIVPPGDHPFTDDYSDLLRYLTLGS
jgi:spermidine synthase